MIDYHIIHIVPVCAYHRVILKKKYEVAKRLQKFIEVGVRSAVDVTLHTTTIQFTVQTEICTYKA